MTLFRKTTHKSKSAHQSTQHGQRRKGLGKSRRRGKMSEYERGRKPAPQSLKKISSSSRGFFITRKPYSDDD